MTDVTGICELEERTAGKEIKQREARGNPDAGGQSMPNRCFHVGIVDGS